MKTFRSLISSLRASAFRRAVCDGRTWTIREVRTHRSLLRKGRHAVSSPAFLDRLRIGRP